MNEDIFYRVDDTFYINPDTGEPDYYLHVMEWYGIRETRKGMWIYLYPTQPPDFEYAKRKKMARFVLNLSETEAKFPTPPRRFAYRSFQMAMKSYRARKHSTVWYAEQNMIRGKRGIHAANYVLDNGLSPDDVRLSNHRLRADWEANNPLRLGEDGS